MPHDPGGECRYRGAMRSAAVVARRAAVVTLVFIQLSCSSMVGARLADNRARSESLHGAGRGAAEVIKTYRRGITDPRMLIPSPMTLARLVSEIPGSVVFSAGGDTRKSGVTIVVRLRANFQTVAGEQRVVSGCFALTVGAFVFDVETATIRCPRGAPMQIAPAPAAPPDLGGVVPVVKAAIDALGSDRQDATLVHGIVEPIATLRGGSINEARRGSVLGFAILLPSGDCINARIGTSVEVWRPREVYPLYARPGEGTCSGVGAIQRSNQRPPTEAT